MWAAIARQRFPFPHEAFWYDFCCCELFLLMHPHDILHANRFFFFQISIKHLKCARKKTLSYWCKYLLVLLLQNMTSVHENVSGCKLTQNLIYIFNSPLLSISYVLYMIVGSFLLLLLIINSLFILAFLFIKSPEQYTKQLEYNTTLHPLKTSVWNLKRLKSIHN